MNSASTMYAATHRICYHGHRAGPTGFRLRWIGFSGGTGQEPWQKEVTHEDVPLSNLFVTMLQRLGVETKSFSDSTGALDTV